jgi:hypothetical protein
VKSLDLTLSPAERRRFGGAIFNVYRAVDPVQADMCFDRAKCDYPVEPSAGALAADLIQAGWRITPAEVGRLLAPHPHPRPLAFDLQADAAAQPPWPHLAGASWIDALELVNRSDRDAREAQMLGILGDERLPLPVRVAAGYAAQMTAMLHAVAKLPPGASIAAMLAAQAGALDDAHARGEVLRFNAQAECDYTCAIASLSRCFGTAVPTPARVERLRALGWKIHDEDLAAVNALIVASALGSAQAAISSWMSTPAAGAGTGAPAAPGPAAPGPAATRAAGDF